VEYELVKFRKDISCKRCSMKLVENGTILAVVDDHGCRVYAQSSGGYTMDELQGRYTLQCDCGEVASFRTTADATPLLGSPEGLLPIPVRRQR
jgi:hypothetical protein